MGKEVVVSQIDHGLGYGLAHRHFLTETQAPGDFTETTAGSAKMCEMKYNTMPLTVQGEFVISCAITGHRTSTACFV